MLRIPYPDSINFSILKPNYRAVFIQGLKKLLSAVKDINLRTEDSAYKWEFTRRFMPELYKTHTSELEMNCAFCENLIRASCHRNCFKCRTGTYIYCSPLLPGIQGCGAPRPGSADAEPVPWYYKNACPNFRRLEPKNYFRNFIIPLSSSTIDNFEVLEGLTCGLSSGEKPCRICASVDYGIYKACSSHKGFDKSAPCDRIAALMTSRYRS
jgi:hypothetical protein